MPWAMRKVRDMSSAAQEVGLAVVALEGAVGGGEEQDAAVLHSLQDGVAVPGAEELLERVGVGGGGLPQDAEAEERRG